MHRSFMGKSRWPVLWAVASVISALASTGALGAPSLTLFEAKFDGSVDGTDARGAVKPLSVEGKVAYAPGRTGQALICGGDGAQLKYPVDGHLVASHGTVEMWVKGVDWPKDEQAYHVFFETEGPGWLVLYKFWSGGAAFLSGEDHPRYTAAFLKECTCLGDGQWHHLAGVWGPQKVAFYVDGVLRSSVIAPSLPQGFAGYFTVGDAPWSKPHASHTLLQDVKVYRVALPDDQIALAAQGKPLTYRPEVRLDIQPHPVAGEWKVMVDASGFIGGDQPGATATVEVLSEGKPVAAGQVEGFKDGLGSVTLNIGKVPVGAVVVKGRVVDAAGKEMASAEVPFQKPADAPWPGNRIGMEDRVLPPFTAMRATGNDVECWGRKYAMGAGAFPAQIESLGQPMLSEPVRLSVTTSRGEVSFQNAAGKVLSCSPTRAQVAGSADAPELDLKTETTIEYDGMLWTEVTLTPKSPMTLTEVTLHIPVRTANALYEHHTRGAWGEDNAGAMPANGYEAKAFQPFLWLGDNDRGLGWFAESQRSWSNVPGKPIQRIVKTGETTEMLIYFVNRSTLIKEPFRLSFGLQATPVKPRPADVRTWRPSGANSTMDAAGMGTIQLVWPNGHMAYYGYPWPADVEKFRALVTEAHAKHIRVVVYINLNYFSTGALESAYYSPDWIDHGRSCGAETGDVGQMGYTLFGSCPHCVAWRDFIAWKIAKFIDEFQIDGIYVDCWSGYECLENHGCGWRDDKGIQRGTFPIRDYREIIRRVRELFQDRRPNPLVIVHMSNIMMIPMHSFADMMLDGEEYQDTWGPGEDYLNVIPLDRWRAEHTGRQWGVVSFFLPMFMGHARVETVPTERMMGLMLAHDITPWPLWSNSNVIFAAWKALDKFGAADAEFLPYWAPNGITTDNKDFIVSVYQKPGRALLVVLNTSKADGPVNVSVDAKRLGLKAGWSAKDFPGESPLPISGQGIKLTIPGRNYRLVVLE